MKRTDNIAYHKYDKAQGNGTMTTAHGTEAYSMTIGTRMAMLFVMLLLTFLSLSCPPLHAQNNPYKINDKLFVLYTNAFKYRNSQRGLALADSLYSQAVVLNDRKAQCLALVVNMLHESNKRNNEKAFETALHRLQEKAKETGYMQYYFYGVQTKVTMLLNEDKSYTAINYLEGEQKEAVRLNDKYGIYTCMKAMGQAYIFRQSYEKAKEIYLKAYEYGKANCPTQDMSIVLYRLAEGANSDFFFKDGLEYARKGLKEAKTRQSRIDLKTEELIALFYLGQDDEFKQIYDEIKKDIIATNNASTYYDKNTTLQIMRMVVDGQYDKAEKTVKDTKNISMRSNLLIEIYTRQNKLLDVIEQKNVIIAFIQKRKDKLVSNDLSEVNARFDYERLESEKKSAELANTQLSLNNANLKLRNTQLTLTNSSLELGRVKFAEKMARLNAANYKLNLDNKQLEAKQLKDSLKQEHLIQKAKEAEQEAHERVTDITIIALVGLLTLAILYMLYRNKLASQLQDANLHLAKKNEDLKIAKDKAEQADNIKTMFMQNMSHEIRTPLNAIVGFSQVMTDMGDELTPDEKKEMSERIRNNSDLLLTLINDILDITSIESGRYVMKMSDVKVNETMRSTLDTVAHRKASGVELKMETDADEDMTIRTDNVRVKQVLINMLTNAEKNTEHGSITLRFSQKENPGMYTFSVTDTGIGIPRDKMDEIFERFKKLDNFKQGTGLGLNISAVIAQKLGGSIWVDREYTGGARFYFTIKAQ